MEAGIAVLWIGGAGYLYVQAQRYAHRSPSRTSDPDKIKALEEELRPWEPWSLDTEGLEGLPERVRAKEAEWKRQQPSSLTRVLLSGTPGPETREWLYRDNRDTCNTCEDQHHREEGTK